MKGLGAIGFVFSFAAAVLPAANSPLADAVEKSDRTAIRVLLKKRADVNAPQVDGMNTSGKIFRTREESRRKVADTEKRDAS